MNEKTAKQIFDLIEPGISPRIEGGAFNASAAISLKRIADALEGLTAKERNNQIMAGIVYGRMG